MIIQSENKAVEKELRGLEKALIDEGAWFHDGLAIIDQGGSLSMQMVQPLNQDELLVKVPESLLVPTEPLNISVKGNQFFLDPDKGKMTPAQIDIGQRMFEIYNLTDKPDLHRREYSWLQFREAPQWMDKLLRARSSNEHYNSRLRFVHNVQGCMSEDEFVKDSFLKSRVLGQKGKGDKPTKVQKIMPIVDYFNHDFRGSPFMLPSQEETERFLRVQNRQPFLHMRECYVTYGLYDTLDTFFGYGFPDIYPPFVRSVPLEVVIEDIGKIIVKSFPAGHYGKPLHKQISDLKNLMPAVAKNNDGNLELSHLIIPVDRTPHALRRILRVLIRTFAGPDASQEFVLKELFKMERQILEKNIEFYEDLLADLEASSDTPAHIKACLLQIATVQRNKLYKYHYNYALKAQEAEEGKIETSSQEELQDPEAA